MKVTSDQVTSNQLKELPITGYKKLITWQKADQLAEYVYSLTYKFPREELFGLTSQLRRAVLSVPLNIVKAMRALANKNLPDFFSSVWDLLLKLSIYSTSALEEN